MTNRHGLGTERLVPGAAPRRAVPLPLVPGLPDLRDSRSVWQAGLWYVLSVICALRGVVELGSDPWPVTAALLAGALVSVGLAARHSPLHPD